MIDHGGGYGQPSGEGCRDHHRQHEDGKDNVLQAYLSCPPAHAYGIGHATQMITHQGDVGRFYGCVGACRAHGDPHIGVGQGRRIVDAVTHHRHRAVFLPDPPDRFHFSFRFYSGDVCIHTGRSGNSLRCGLAVACEHDHFQSQAMQLIYHLRRPRAYLVTQSYQPGYLCPLADHHHCFSLFAKQGCFLSDLIREGFLFKQLRFSDIHVPFREPGPGSAARLYGKITHFDLFQSFFRGLSDNSSGERMLREPFHLKGHVQHFPFRFPVKRHNIRHHRLTGGQRTCLVEHHHAYLLQILQVGPAFNQYAFPTGLANASRHGHWRGHHQGTGSCRHQQHDRLVIPARHLQSQDQWHHDQQDGSSQHHRGIDLPELLYKGLRPAFLLLGLFHQVDHLRKGIVFIGCRRFDLQGAVEVQRPRKDPVTTIFFHRHRFAGYGRLIHARPAFFNDTIGRDGLTGTYEENISRLQPGSFHPHLFPFAYHGCFFGRQVHQLPYRLPCAGIGILFQPFGQRIQHHQQGCFLPHAQDGSTDRGKKHQDLNTNLFLFRQLFQPFPQPVMASQDHGEQKTGNLRDPAYRPDTYEPENHPGQYTRQQSITDGRKEIPFYILV